MQHRKRAASACPSCGGPKRRSEHFTCSRACAIRWESAKRLVLISGLRAMIDRGHLAASFVPDMEERCRAYFGADWPAPGSGVEKWPDASATSKIVPVEVADHAHIDPE